MLNGNFGEVFDALQADGSGVRFGWGHCLGPAMMGYFRAFSSGLKTHKFNFDDLLRRVFNDAAPKHEVAFHCSVHSVRQLLRHRDGVLCLQTTPDK